MIEVTSAAAVLPPEKPLVEWALGYAARGWHVLPLHWIDGGVCSCLEGVDCISPGKHPIGHLCPKGFYDATTDPDQIRKWWKAHPKANIGIRTGIESNIIVVDVDYPDKLLEVEPDPKSNIIAKSGRESEGFHLYYWHPGDTIGCKSFDFGELKSDGGYVVAPPSRHVTGRRYKWLAYGSQTPADPPDWLNNLISDHTNSDNGVKWTATTELHEGERHNTLRSFAARIRNTGAETVVIKAALETVNQLYCKPPIPQQELTDLAEWAGKLEATTSLQTDPAEYFNKKEDGTIKSFIPKKLADDIKAGNLFITPYGKKQQGRRSRIYTYHPEIGIWFPDGVEKIDEIAARALSNLYKSYYVDEVVKLIRKTTLRNQFPEAPLNLIGLKNGVYDLNTDNLLSFNPTHYLRQSLPIEYDPDAKCPETDKFIDQVVPGYRNTIYELAGYFLYREYVYAVIFIFLGEGDNGKSTLLNLFKSFLGAENISTVTMQQLAKDTFASADLYGRLANLCDDIPSNPIKITGQLKMLTGRAPMRGQFKNHDAFDFVNYAVLVFTCNELPPTYDNTEAWFKRPIVINFPNKFVRGTPECNPDIIRKITTPQELSGLFNEAIRALRNLLKRHTFTNEKTKEQKKKEYIMKSSPAQYFIQEFIEPNPNSVGYMEKGTLYREHVQFVRNKLHRRPVSSEQFSRLLKIYAPGWDEGTATIDTGKREKSKKVYRKARVWYYIQLNREKIREWEPPTT